jgi:hypothetical protein
MKDELHDIIDPAPLLPGMHVPWYAWLILAFVIVAAIGLLIYFLTRPKPAAPGSVASIYEESRKHLELLLGTIDKQPLSQVATEASFSVRRYLAACLSEPALYETHEEFLLRDDALDRLPTGTRDKLNPLLEKLATLKYSPSHTDPENAEIILKKSLNTLQGIESTRAKEIPSP